MHLIINAENTARCSQLHLNPKGQMRSPYVYKNLWWTFEGDPEGEAWGYGDLDPDDLRRILEWIEHPSHAQDKVFVGWNEHHGTEWQQTPHPMVRISIEKAIEFPHRDAQEARKARA